MRKLSVASKIGKASVLWISCVLAALIWTFGQALFHAQLTRLPDSSQIHRLEGVLHKVQRPDLARLGLVRVNSAREGLVYGCPRHKVDALIKCKNLIAALDGQPIKLGYLELRRSYGTDLVVVELSSDDANLARLVPRDALQPYFSALGSAALTTLAISALLALVIFVPALASSSSKKAQV